MKKLFYLIIFICPALIAQSGAKYSSSGYSTDNQMIVFGGGYFQLNGTKIDSIYATSDTLYFVTDSGKIKLPRVLPAAGDVSQSDSHE